MSRDYRGLKCGQTAPWHCHCLCPRPWIPSAIKRRPGTWQGQRVAWSRSGQLGSSPSVRSPTPHPRWLPLLWAMGMAGGCGTVSSECSLPLRPPSTPSQSTEDGRGGHSMWRRRTAKHGCWVPSAPAPQVLAPPGNSREASILALLFLAGAAVLTGATGTAVQGHLTVSALGRESGMGTPGARGITCSFVPSSAALGRTCSQSTGGRWGTRQATLPSRSSLPPPGPSRHSSLHSPYSRWNRHTCTLEGGRYGSCPGSGTGWTSRDHTWPGQPEWGDLRPGEEVPIRRRWGGPSSPLRTPSPSEMGGGKPSPQEMVAISSESRSSSFHSPPTTTTTSLPSSVKWG